MVRQTARVLVFEILGGLLFLAVLAAALFAWRLSQGPVWLNAFKDDIEAALTDARGGRGVSLAAVALEWSPEARRVNVTAYGVGFRDSRGAPSGRADRAEIVLDASALLLGEAEVLSMRLIDGALTVEQVSNAVWEVGGEPLPPIPAGTLPGTPAEWVALIERAAASIMTGGRRTAAGMGLERVSVDRFTVDILLQDGTRLARIADTSGALARSGDELTLDLSGRGEGAGLPRAVTLGIRSADGFTRLDGELSLAGWSAPALLKRIGIAPDRASGLPADMTFTFEFADQQGLTGFSAILDAGAGDVLVAGQRYGIDTVSGRLDYDPVRDIAALQVDRLEADLLSGSFRLRLDDAVRPADLERPVQLTAQTLDIDLTPRFEAPFRLTDVALDGTANLTAHALDMTSLAASVDGARITASGQLARIRDAGAGELPLRLDAELSLEGPLGVGTVTRFWPVKLGEGARRFAANRIEAGTVTEAVATVRLRRDSLADKHLRDSDLDVRFTATGVRVRPLSDMPAVDNATGTGHLTGNRLVAELASGTFGSWTLDSGQVYITRFHPKGGDILVEATGKGVARDVLGYVFNSRLDLQAKTGFDPGRVSGDAEARFTMRRPARDDVPLEDMDFRVVAEVRNAGLTELGAGFDLNGGRARVDVDTSTVRVTGNGLVGPAPVVFAWRDGLDDDGDPASLTAQATVTPDFLNAFGLLGRPYLTGEIPVDVSATLDGSELRTADVDLDLTGARIDLAEIGWLKPPGTEARALLGYDFSGPTRIASADLQSPTAGLSGDVRLGPDGRLQTFDLRRAFLEGRADVTGKIVREAAGGFTLTLGGPFLDVSPLIADFGLLAGSAPASDSVPLTLSARVDRLRFSAEDDLLDAVFEASTDRDGLVRMAASGQTETGAATEALYQREGNGAAVSLRGEDAGFLVSALFGSDIIEAGEVDLTGRLDWGEAPSDLLLTLRNARLRNAPILTQLLSLASLRGLVDTLGGEGVLFSDVRIPMQLSDGRYIVTGGRASGPALGLTLNGWVEPAGRRMEASGVLVPSFGVNSALGGIPIIGDLMVGRDGEGILSLTYSVRGTFDRAQVAVNPLSAIAPGLLRRIFENPADTDLPLPEITPGPGEGAETGAGERGGAAAGGTAPVDGAARLPGQ